MKNMLAYKGYHTKIEFDAESLVLRGKIEGIKDLVNFECTDLADVEQEFHNAVDEYLEFCKEVGKEPDRQLAIVAMKKGDTLNSSVEKAIAEYVALS